MELSTRFTADLMIPDGTRIPLPVQLTYSTEDPYAVRADFYTGLDEPVSWVFSRDFLRGKDDIGHDVRSWIGHDEDLHLKLSSPYGTAEFILPTTQIVLFRRDMFRMVPDGEETDFLNLDSRLQEFLINGSE